MQPHRTVNEAVLTLLSQYLSAWRGLRLFDPEGVVRLFERSLQRELNFEYEKNNLEQILTLPGSTVLAPGHGPLTSVGEEQKNNPFFAR